MNKKIKIFGTPWHVAHQHSLFSALKDKVEFYHVVNTVRVWGTKFRPYPENLNQVSHYEPGVYDLALLHVDQQCVDPTLGKTRLYKELNETIKDIPKIVINHGTPYWPEVYEDDQIKSKMRMMLDGNHIVVNSHKAKEMWGDMGKSIRAIIHGIDDEGWKDLDKEPRVITMLSPAGLDKYYNRRLLLSVKDKLKDRGIPHCWITVDWEAENFEDYQNFIGRSLLYFNPTLESPMPRSRSEAMLSGACVISLANHGAEKFIDNGKNGFIVPNNPIIIADLIEELLKNWYDKCKKIGQEGKKTAQGLFSKDRYRDEWLSLIDEVMKEKK